MKLGLMLLLGLNSFEHANGFVIVWNRNLSFGLWVLGSVFGELVNGLGELVNGHGHGRGFGRGLGLRLCGLGLGLRQLLRAVFRSFAFPKLWQHHDSGNTTESATNMWANTHVSVSVLGFNEAGELHMMNS